MKQFNYYELELERLQDNDDLPKSLIVYDGMGGKTKQLNITLESIQVLIDFLLDEQERLQEQGV